MLVCGIIFAAIYGADLSLAGNAALQLLADLSGGALFERIGATGREQRACDWDEDRQGLHLLILGSRSVIARALRCLSVEAFKG